MTFCEHLYKEILESYQDSEKYRIRKNEEEVKVRIEYIPDGLENYFTNLFSDKVSFIKIYLKNPVYMIDLKLRKNETGDDYLVVCVHSKIKCLCFSAQERQYFLTREGSFESSVLIYSPQYMYSVNFRNKFYPATFKTLETFPTELLSILLPHFTGTLLWKDFLADNFYPPVKINELSNYYNRKDYLEKTFDLCLPKYVNRLSLKHSYAICCSLKYIKSEQTQSIFHSKYNFNLVYKIDRRKKKSIAREYLEKLICKRLAVTGVDVRMQCIISDYVDFSLKLNRQIDIFSGKKKIIRLHDKMTEEIMRNANRGLKIKIPETPLKYLKLPEEFVLLKTQTALEAEGNYNHNCVGGYGEDIKKGRCVIYSADIQNEHLTIEIKFRKLRNSKKEYKFYINQCMKKYNEPCSKEALDYVNECLESCSDRAIKKFLDFNNKN